MTLDDDKLQLRRARLGTLKSLLIVGAGLALLIVIASFGAHWALPLLVLSGVVPTVVLVRGMQQLAIHIGSWDTHAIKIFLATENLRLTQSNMHAAETTPTA